MPSQAYQRSYESEPRISDADQHECRKRCQDGNSAPAKSRMQTSVFDRVVQDARERRDFRNRDQSPKSDCVPHVGNASDGWQKDAATSKNYHSFMKVWAP